MSTRSISPRPRRRPYAAEMRILRNFKKSPAVLSKDQMYEAERIAQQEDVYRRMGFGILTRSGVELIESFGRDASREAAFAGACGAEWVSRYRERLKTLDELMSQAEIRMKIAMCGRDDAQELWNEARTEAYATKP